MDMSIPQMHPGPEILLKTEKLAVGFRGAGQDNILLQNLKLKIVAGELVCFMGPNGVGKTTLLKTLVGLHKPLHGEVFTEKSINAPRASKITPIEKDISLVLTDRISAVNMTVYELVTYGRYPHLEWNLRLSDTDRKVIQRSIELTRISHLADKKLYELSDGQLQLTMIARALAQDTQLILLDEPTAHLDLNNRVEIMNLLRQLSHETKKGILLATHELDLAIQTADVIWLAGKDKNILTGLPEDLILNGLFDEIFQFKGYDLKTGKVTHEPWRKVSINLKGSGYEFLWTKNALERCGYTISNQGNDVIIRSHEDKLSWEYRDQRFYSLHDLIQNI